MNQRIQYYGPDGGKLPIGLKDAHYGFSRGGNIFLSVGIEDEYVIYKNIFSERPRHTFRIPVDQAISEERVVIDFLHKSYFTEEELKELVDEKDF